MATILDNIVSCCVCVCITSVPTEMCLYVMTIRTSSFIVGRLSLVVVPIFSLLSRLPIGREICRVAELFHDAFVECKTLALRNIHYVMT